MSKWEELEKAASASKAVGMGFLVDPSAILELLTERDALKAELERIRSLKPSAYWCDGEYFDTEEEAQNFCDKEAQLSETITPLYTLGKP